MSNISGSLHRALTSVSPQTYLFPQLAQRMEEFKMDEKHRESHKGIHDGAFSSWQSLTIHS